MAVASNEDIQRLFPPLKGKPRLVDFLLKLTAMDGVNGIDDRVSAITDNAPDYALGVMQDIGVDYLVGNAGRLQSLPEGPFITVSNHPYGHIDGIIMVDLFGHLRAGQKVLVNKLLMMLRGLTDNFISVDPVGAERTAATGTSVSGIKQALQTLRDGSPLHVFASGAVSDLKLRDRCRISDRPWQDAAVKLIKKARVPVVPVHFLDRNSLFYYLLGLIDYRIRLVRLCHEVFNKRDSVLRLSIGETIPVERQDAIKDLEEFKAFLRSSVYDMPPAESFTPRSELSLSPSKPAD